MGSTGHHLGRPLGARHHGKCLRVSSCHPHLSSAGGSNTKYHPPKRKLGAGEMKSLADVTQPVTSDQRLEPGLPDRGRALSYDTMSSVDLCFQRGSLRHRMITTNKVHQTQAPKGTGRPWAPLTTTELRDFKMSGNARLQPTYTEGATMGFSSCVTPSGT